MDSDDWVEDNTIELLLKEAIEKNLDIVCCGIEKNYSFGKDEKFTDSGNVVFDIKSCISNYLSGRKVCTVAWNKLYRISLFENIRYPVGKLNEDEFTTYKLIIRANTVGYIENNLYHYYQRDDSIMGANKIIDRLDIFDALIERMNEFKKAGYIKYASLTWIQLVDTAYFYGVKTTLGENGSKRIQLLMQSISESMIQPIWYEISVLQRIKTNLKLFVLRTRTHRKKFRI